MSNAILIPEIEIYETLQNILEFVRKDYEVKTDKTKTFLYYVFGKREDGRQLKLGSMVLFDEAVDVIVNGDNKEKKRKVEVTVGYNQARMALPTLHIVMPSESPKNAGIGDNRGYTPGLIDVTNTTKFDTVTQDSSVVYSILITSDNVNECIILYNFLKAAFLGFKLQLELRGLQNVKSGGTDLNLAEDLIPVNIYHRSFNLAFDYDYTTVDMFGEGYIKTMSFEVIPVEKTE